MKIDRLKAKCKGAPPPADVQNLIKELQVSATQGHEALAQKLSNIQVWKYSKVGLKWVVCGDQLLWRDPTRIASAFVCSATAECSCCAAEQPMVESELTILVAIHRTQSDFYYWHDIVDLFDDILAQATAEAAYSVALRDSDTISGGETSRWYMQIDIPQNDSLRNVVCEILHFFSLLIENTFSRSSFSSIDRLYNLLYSDNLNVVYNVLVLLYTFARRSNLFGRLQDKQKRDIFSVLHMLASPWTNTAVSFTLAACCSRRQPLPTDATCIKFQCQAKSSTTEAGGSATETQRIMIDTDVADRAQMPTAQLMHVILKTCGQELSPNSTTLPELDEKHQQKLYLLIRLAKHFTDPTSRVMNVQVRLQALTVLLHNNALNQSKKFLYTGFLGELVDILKLDEDDLADIKTCVLRTLTAIIHYSNAEPERLNSVLQATGLASPYGTIPSIVRDCVSYLTANSVTAGNVMPSSSSSATSSAEKAALARRFPVQYTTAIFSFLYHISNYGSGIDALTNADMMQTMLRIINHYESTDESLGFATRAVRVVDLLANNNLTLFRNASGFSCMTARLAHEVQCCLQESQQQQAADAAANASPSATVHTCHPQRAALMKSALSFLKKAFPDAAFNDNANLRDVFGEETRNALKSIVERCEFFGPSLFLMTLDVITSFINAEPASLSDFQASGLTKAILDAVFTRKLPATREIITSLPHTCTALCTNARGVEEFRSVAPFDRICQILLSEEYLSALRRKKTTAMDATRLRGNEPAQALGSTLEQLAQHYPVLRQDAVRAVVNMLNRLVEMGNGIAPAAVSNNATATTSSNAFTQLPTTHHGLLNVIRLQQANSSFSAAFANATATATSSVAQGQVNDLTSLRNVGLSISMQIQEQIQEQLRQMETTASPSSAMQQQQQQPMPMASASSNNRALVLDDPGLGLRHNESVQSMGGNAVDLIDFDQDDDESSTPTSSPPGVSYDMSDLTSAVGAGTSGSSALLPPLPSTVASSSAESAQSSGNASNNADTEMTDQSSAQSSTPQPPSAVAGQQVVPPVAVSVETVPSTIGNGTLQQSPPYSSSAAAVGTDLNSLQFMDHDMAESARVIANILGSVTSAASLAATEPYGAGVAQAAQQQQTLLASPMPVQSATLAEIISNVACFTEAFINNANMRPDATARNVQDFAAQNGIKAVVSLLKLNNVALDFPLHSACSALAKLVRTLHNGWNNGSPSALLNAGSGKLLDDILESLRNLIDEGVRLMRSNVSENTSNIGSNPTQLTGELAVQTALSRELLAVRACSIASSKALLKYTSTLDSNAFSMSDRCPLAQKLTQIHTHIYVLSSLCKSSARQISSSNANSISSSFVLNPLAPQLVSYMIALYDMLVWESVSLVSLGEIQPTIVRSTTAMITPGTMAVQAAALAAASTASPFSIENILFNSNNMASPMVTSASSAGSQNASNMPPLVNSDVASYSISQPQFISNGSSASTSSFDALNLMVNAALAAETTAAPNAPSMQSSMDINTSGKQRGTTDVVKLMQPTLTIVTKLSCAIGDLLQAICRMPYQQQLQQRHRRNRQGALIQQAQQQGLLNQANDKLFKSLATSMKQSLLWEPPSGAVNKNEEVSLAATRRQTDMRHMYLACIVSMLGKMLVSDSRQAFGDTLQAMIREGTLDVCSKLYYWSLKPLNLLNGASSGDFTDISDDAGDERRKSNRADQQQPPLVMSSAQSEFLAHWLELAQLLANKRVVVDSSHSVMQPSSSPARGAENRSSTPSPMTAEQTAANNRDALVAIHKYVVPILKQFYQHTDLYCTLPSPIPAHYFSLLRAVLSSSDLVTSHIARQQASAAAAASVAASVAEQLSSSSSASTSASAPSSSSTATIDLAETSAGVTSNPSIPTSSATGPGNLPTVAEVSGDTTSSASSIGNSSQQSFADFIAAATAALSAGGASSSVRPLATAGTSSIPTESDNSAAVIQPTSAAAGQQPPPPPQPSSAVDVEQQRQNAITSVCEMGFDRPTAIRALHLNDWQVEAAVNLLLTLQPAQLQAMAAVYDDDDDLMLSIERYGAPLPPPPPPLPHLSRSGTSLVADGSASDQNTAAVDTGRRVSVTSSPADILTEAADVRDTVAVYQASLNEDDYKSLRSDVVPLINIMSFLASKNTSSGNLSSVSRPSNTVTTSPVTAKYSADIVFRVVDIVQLCARQNGPEWREQLIVLVVERIVEYVEYVSRAFRTGVETCIEPDKLVQVIQQFDQNEPTSNKLEAFMHFAALLLERSSGKPYWHVIFNTSVKNGDGGAQQQPLYQQFHQSLMSLVSTARYVLQQVKCGAVQAPQWLTLAFLLLDLSDRQCLAQQRNAHARERYSSGRWKYFDVKTSRWLPFDVAQCEDINKAFDEGKNDAQITFDMGPASAVQQQTSQRSTPFSTVYFDHMVMINHRTNTRRPVMRDLDEFDAAYEAAKSSKIAKLSGIGMKAPASMPSDLGKSGKREDTQSNGSSTDKDSAQKKRQKSSSDSSMQSQQPSPAARRTVKLLKRAHAGGARGGSARKNVPTAMSAQRGSNKTAFPLTSKTSSAGPKLQQQGESTPQQQQPQSDAATSALSDDCFAPPYSISALSKDEQHAIMLDSIELIKAGHPLLLNAIMRYMLRLTRSPSNAVFFVKSGGLRALFGLSRAAYFPEFTSLLTHIVRHVIEQPPVLIKRMVDVVDFILHNVYSKSIANPAIQGIAGTPTANDLNNDLFIALNRLWPAGLRSPYMMEQVAKRLIGVTALPGIVSASSSGDTGASGSTASIAEKLVVERRPATQLHQYHHNQPSTPHQQRVRFAGNMPSSAELHGRTPLRQQPTATPTSRHAGLQFSFDATTNTSAAASCTNAATSGGNAFEELFMRHSDQVSYDAMIRGVVEDMLSLLLIRPAAGSNGLRSGVSPLALLVKNNQLTASVPNGEDAHMEDVSGNHTMQTDGGGETSAKTLSSRAMFDNNVGVSCVLSRSNVLDMMALLLQQYPLVLTHIANAVVVESTTGAAPRVTTLLTATAMDETVKNSNAAGRETSVELGCDIGLQAMNAGGDKITSAVTYILDNLLTERDLMAQAIRDELNSIPAQEVLQGGRSVLDTEMSATSRTRSVLVAAANGDGSSTSQSAPPPSTIALDNAAPPQSSLNAYFNSNNNCSHYSQSDIEECCASANYFFRAIASTTEAPNSQFRVVEDIRKLFGIYAQRLFSCSREEKNKNDVESLMMAPAVTTNNTTAAAPNGMVIDGNSLSSPEEARKVTLPVSISATNDESSRKTTTAVLAGDIAHKLKALCIVVHHMLSHAQNEPMPTGDALAHASKNKRILAKIVHGAASNTVARLIVKSGLARDLGRVLTFCNMDSAYFGSLANALLKPIELLSYQATLTLANNVVNTSSVLRTPGGSTKAQQSTRHHVSPRKCIVSANQRNEPSAQQQQQAVQEQQTAVVNGNNNTVGIDILNDSIVSDLDASTSGDEEQEVGAHDVAGDTADVGGDVNMISHHPPEAGLDRVEMEEALSFMEYQARQMENDESDMIQFEVPNGADSANARRRRRNQHRSEAALMENMMAGLINGANAQLDASADVVNRGVAAFEDQFLADVASPIVNESIAAAGGAVDDAEFGGEDDEDDEEGDDDTENSADSNEDEGEGVAEMDGDEDNSENEDDERSEDEDDGNGEDDAAEDADDDDDDANEQADIEYGLANNVAIERGDDDYGEGGEDDDSLADEYEDMQEENSFTSEYGEDDDEDDEDDETLIAQAGIAAAGGVGENSLMGNARNVAELYFDQQAFNSVELDELVSSFQNMQQNVASAVGYQQRSHRRLMPMIGAEEAEHLYEAASMPPAGRQWAIRTGGPPLPPLPHQITTHNHLQHHHQQPSRAATNRTFVPATGSPLPLSHPLLMPPRASTSDMDYSSTSGGGGMNSRTMMMNLAHNHPLMESGMTASVELGPMMRDAGGGAPVSTASVHVSDSNGNPVPAAVAQAWAPSLLRLAAGAAGPHHGGNVRIEVVAMRSNGPPQHLASSSSGRSGGGVSANQMHRMVATVQDLNNNQHGSASSSSHRSRAAAPPTAAAASIPPAQSVATNSATLTANNAMETSSDETVPAQQQQHEQTQNREQEQRRSAASVSMLMRMLGFSPAASSPLSSPQDFAGPTIGSGLVNPTPDVLSADAMLLESQMRMPILSRHMPRMNALNEREFMAAVGHDPAVVAAGVLAAPNTASATSQSEMAANYAAIADEAGRNLPLPLQDLYVVNQATTANAASGTVQENSVSVRDMTFGQLLRQQQQRPMIANANSLMMTPDRYLSALTGGMGAVAAMHGRPAPGSVSGVMQNMLAQHDRANVGTNSANISARPTASPTPVALNKLRRATMYSLLRAWSESGWACEAHEYLTIVNMLRPALAMHIIRHKLDFNKRVLTLAAAAATAAAAAAANSASTSSAKSDSAAGFSNAVTTVDVAANIHELPIDAVERDQASQSVEASVVAEHVSADMSSGEQADVATSSAGEGTRESNAPLEQQQRVADFETSGLHNVLNDALRRDSFSSVLRILDAGSTHGDAFVDAFDEDSGGDYPMLSSSVLAGLVGHSAASSFPLSAIVARENAAEPVLVNAPERDQGSLSDHVWAADSDAVVVSVPVCDAASSSAMETDQHVPEDSGEIAQNSADLSSSETDYEALQAELTARHARIANAVAESQASLDALRAQQAMLASVVTDALMAQRDDAVENATAGEGPASSMQLAESSNIGEPQQVSDSPVPASASSVQPMSITSDDTNTSSTSTAENVMSEQQPQVNDDVVMTPAASASTAFSSGADTAAAATAPPVVLDNPDNEIPDELPAEFLRELPEDMRNELVSQHRRTVRLRDERRRRAQEQAQRQQAAAQAAETSGTAAGGGDSGASSTAAAMPDVSEVDPEILAQLPPEIQEEVLAQQRAAAAARQERENIAAGNSSASGGSGGAAGSSTASDPAAFFSTLAPDLRRQVLMDMDDSQLTTLPENLRQEAQQLRRSNPRRFAHTQEEMLARLEAEQQALEQAAAGVGRARRMVASIANAAGLPSSSATAGGRYRAYALASAAGASGQLAMLGPSFSPEDAARLAEDGVITTEEFNNWYLASNPNSSSRLTAPPSSLSVSAQLNSIRQRASGGSGRSHVGTETAFALPPPSNQRLSAPTAPREFPGQQRRNVGFLPPTPILNNASQSPLPTSKPVFGRQVFDLEGLTCLTMILTACSSMSADNLDLARLQRILRNLCLHGPTRQFVISSLVSLLDKCGQSSHEALSANAGKNRMKLKWLSLRSNTSNSTSNNSSAGGNEMMATEDNDLTTSTAVAGGEQSTSADSPQSKPTTMFTVCNPIENDGVGIKFSSSAEILFAVQPEAASFLCQLLLGTLNFLAQHFPDALLPLVITRNFNLRTCNIAAPPALRSNAEGVTDSDGNLLGLKPVMSSSSMSPVSPLKQQQQLHGRHQINRRGARGAPAPPLASNDMSFRSAAAGLQQQQKQPESMWDIALRIESCHHGQQFNDDRDNTAGNAVEQVTRHSTVLVPQVPVQMQLLLANDISSTNARAASNIHSNNTPFVAPASRQPPPPSKQVTADNEFFDSLIPFQYPLVQSVSMTDSPVAHIIRLLNQPLARTGSDGVTDAVFRCCKMLFGSLKQREVVVPMRASALVAHLERSQKSLATRKTALSLLSSRHQQQAAAAAAKPKVNATTQASETAATTLASVASGDNAIISNSSPAVHPAADPQPVDEKQAIVPLMLTASSSGVVMPERNTFADLSSLLSSTKSEHMARWTQVVPERLFIHPDVLDSSNAARNHSMTSAALSECFSTVVSAYAGRRARSLVFDGSQRARKALLSNENSQNNVDDEQETVVSGLECLIEPFEFASMRQPAVDERENSTLAAQCVDALQKIADRIGLQAYSTRAIMSVKRDEKYTGTSAMRALLSDNERIDVIVKRATREFATERLPETVQHEISPNTGKSSARSLLACLAVELRQTEEISTLLKELMQCFHRQPRRAGQLGLIDACAILGRACEKLGFASRATSLEMLVSSLIDLALKEVLVELQSLNEEVCKRLSEKQQQQTKNGTATNNTPAASTPEGGEAPPALAPRLPQHQPAAARRLAAAMLGNAAGGGRAGMPAAGPPACLFSFTAASKFTSKNGAQLGVYSLLKAALQCRSRFFASRQAYDITVFSKFFLSADVYYMLPNSTINSILGRLIGDYVHYIEKVLHDECTQAAASDNINSVVNLPAALGESEPMDVDVVLPAAGSGVVQVNEAAEIASAAATVANAATASTAASTTTTAAAARPPTASAGAAAQAHVHSRPAPPLGFNIEPPAIESLPQLSAVQGVWETLSETLANLEQLGDIGSALLLLPLIESFFLLYAPQPMNVLLGPITSSLVELFSSSNQWTMAYGPHSRRGAAAQHQAHHAAYLFGAGGGVNSSSFGPLQQLQMLNPFGTSSASQQGTGTAAGGAGDAQFLFGHYQRPTAAAAAAAHGRHTHLADMAPGGPTRSYQMAISDALSRRGHGAGSANSAASAFITDNSFRQFFGAQTSVMAVNAAAATALASNLNDTMGAANDAAGTLQHQPVVDIESYGSMPSTHSGFFADLQATTSSAPATSGEQNAGAAASTAATSASNSAANPNHVLPIYSQNNMMTLITFAERHKTLINEILRYSSVHITETPFAVLISLTRVLDFDVKRRFFRQQLDIVDRASNRASQLSRMGRFGGPDVVLRVRRGSVFEDSFRDLHRRGPDGWRSRFYIIFDNEEGQDAGGLLREWYTIMAREIFNPMYGLFKTSPGDRATHMINAASYINSNHLSYFKFVGRFIGKAILDNKLLDCFFTRSFYKHILGKPVRYTDMESEDPDFYNGLLFLLTHKVSELGYDLTFSTEVQEYGVTQIGDLKPNGRNLPVTDDSKHEYVPLVCQMKMTHAIKQQLKSFLEGFYELIPNHLISMFNEQELELLISGMPNIDVDDLRNNTDYHRYDSTSPQIIWFWQALKSFQQDERAKFLQFVTGTSKVPLQGFAALEGMNGTQKLQIFRDDRGNDRLPCAHTCFNQLDLPPYESYDKLRQMLLYAVNECSEGFGFA